MEFDNEEEPIKSVSPTLRQDLAGIYPDATGPELDKYVDLIRTYDTEVLPPTRAALRYKEITKEIKELEVEQAELKETVLRQYKLINHQVGGVKIIEANGKCFDMDKLISWATLNLDPTDLEYVLGRTLDDKKFTQLILENKVLSQSIPNDLYKEKPTTFRVEIEGSRSRKK